MEFSLLLFTLSLLIVFILLVYSLISYLRENTGQYVCKSCLHENPPNAMVCEFCGKKTISTKYSVSRTRTRYINFYSRLKMYEVLPPFLDEPDEILAKELLENVENSIHKDTKLEKGLRKFVKKHKTHYLKTFFLEEQGNEPNL